jgi:hypothetical protein
MKKHNTEKIIFTKIKECDIFDDNKYLPITNNGFLYIVKYKKDDIVKIGITNNFKKRYKSLKKTSYYMQNDIDFILLSNWHKDYKENEKILHKQFSKFRIIHTELFKINYIEIIKYINDVFNNSNTETLKNNIIVENDKSKIIFNDKNISYSALGIFMTLKNNKNNISSVVNFLINYNKSTEYAVRKNLRELKKFGYIKFPNKKVDEVYYLSQSGQCIK